ncbi:MAG: hypothetical protein AAGI08_07830 [Bacteroidota bacterium]
MTLLEYQTWLRRARRHAFSDAEAADLLHDVLLSAAKQGRLDLTEETNRRWLSGALRRHAAFLARSTVRRRAREEARAVQREETAEMTDLESGAAWVDILSDLPASARRVVLLGLHGLSRPEIRAALQISDAALRQRLRIARQYLAQLPPDLLQALKTTAAARHEARAEQVPIGLLRRALQRRLVDTPAEIGTHDPDGHPLILDIRR